MVDALATATSLDSSSSPAALAGEHGQAELPRPPVQLTTAITHAIGLAQQTRLLLDLVQARLKGTSEAGARALSALHAHRETLGLLGGFVMLRDSGLTPFEIDALILATAARLDPELRALLGSAGHIVDGAVSAGGVLRMLLPSRVERVERLDSLPVLLRGNLVAHGLIRRPRHEGLDAEIVPARRAASALQGHDLLWGLPTWATVVRRREESGAVELAFDEDPLHHAAALRAGSGAAIVVGAAGIGKTEYARTIAHALSPVIVAIDLALARISTTAAGLGPAVSEIIADASLIGLPVVLDNAHEALGASDAASIEVGEALTRGRAIILCTSDTAALGPAILARAPLRISLALPSAHTRARIWAHALGEGHDVTTLGEEFELTPRQIKERGRAGAEQWHTRPTRRRRPARRHRQPAPADDGASQPRSHRVTSRGARAARRDDRGGAGARHGDAILRAEWSAVARPRIECALLRRVRDW